MIKINISLEFPLIFEFDVYKSIDQSISNGKIPYPEKSEEVALSDQGVMVVGYNDKLKIKNTINDRETEGAILIKNSWGNKWGIDGYGWLPYEYILNGIANDFWSLLQCKWVDMDDFEY